MPAEKDKKKKKQSFSDKWLKNVKKHNKRLKKAGQRASSAGTSKSKKNP